MSDYISEYEFKEAPDKIEYGDGEPVQMSEKFIFYHNKVNFRHELIRLQKIVKTHLNTSLIASAIRDTYLKEEITENNLFMIFTTADLLDEMNNIVEQHLSKIENPGCFYLRSTSKYMLLLAKDRDTLIYGINFVEEILSQTLDDYFSKKKFDDFIKIRPLEIKSCKKE